MCTAHNAVVTIIVVWSVSFLMWGPVIICWDYIYDNERIDHNECYVPFIDNNAGLTAATIIWAFYLPASVMIYLYWRVIRKLRVRQTWVWIDVVNLSIRVLTNLLWQKLADSRFCNHHNVYKRNESIFKPKMRRKSFSKKLSTGWQKLDALNFFLRLSGKYPF